MRAALVARILNVIFPVMRLALTFCFDSPPKSASLLLV